MKNIPVKNELELLHRIVNIASGTFELSEVLEKIADMVVDLVKSDSCLIYLYDEPKKILTLSGAASPHPATMGHVTLGLGEGITGWAAQHKKAVVIAEKAYDDARFKAISNLPEDRFEAFYSAPIFAKNQLIGVLNVHHRKARKYSAQETAILSTICKQVAGIIENAKLHAELLQRTKQIETLSAISKLVAGTTYLDEILRLIVSITAESLGFKICSVMLLDEKSEELSIVATQSLSADYRLKPPVKVQGSLSGRVVLEKKPIAILDVRVEPEYQYRNIAKQEELVSLLSVPMMVKNHCVGVINSYTHEQHVFTESEMKTLASVAHQAAVAIENTRLVKESLQSKEELESRKLVERAKGILMRERGLNEDEAFREIRTTAMDMRKTMRQVAEAILLSRQMK